MLSQTDSMVIRPIHPSSIQEIETVAQRMRLTLIEVLGHERGTDLYSMDWLIERVRYHLDPQQCKGQVWVAADGSGSLAGHCIVRRERDEHGEAYGLFSTTYVAPEFRRQGWAEKFLQTGEAWMLAQRLHRAATDTALHNSRLIRLFQKHGYRIVFSNHEMLRLEKCLT